ncbi:MAG: hypothetical protein AB4050_13820 [Synechococcus sp.]
MDLDRFCVKLFANSGVDIDEAHYINIFHEWIRKNQLEGLLLDVVDYRHIPNGPGIMLISHETNYALDHEGGEFGVYAQRKLGLPGENADKSHSDKIVDLVKATAKFSSLLESDNRLDGELSIDGSGFLYMTNDRLHAPNTDETFAALKSDLEAAAASLYPGKAVTVTRVENDARDRLSAKVSVSEPVAAAALAA